MTRSTDKRTEADGFAKKLCGAAFRDEETWLIRSESLYKVQPEHVIPVRYDAARGDRVFPISPIKVWDVQRNEFV